MSRFARLLILPALAIATPAGAAEPPRYNQVHLQVERSQPVENDRMHAVLSATAEDAEPAHAADEVNRAMAWALKTAKSQPKIEAQTGGYRTYPVYEKQKIARWRAAQELVLEGGDFAQLGALIGKLQERLQVTAVNFTVSPERRRAVEDALIAQALDAFKHRATLVRKQLGAAGYRVIDVAINTGGAVPPPVPMRAEAFDLASKSVAPPALQGGTSTLTVNVGGSIELQ